MSYLDQLSKFADSMNARRSHADDLANQQVALAQAKVQSQYNQILSGLGSATAATGGVGGAIALAKGIRAKMKEKAAAKAKASEPGNTEPTDPEAQRGQVDRPDGNSEGADTSSAGTEGGDGAAASSANVEEATGAAEEATVPETFGAGLEQSAARFARAFRPGMVPTARGPPLRQIRARDTDAWKAANQKVQDASSRIKEAEAGSEEQNAARGELRQALAERTQVTRSHPSLKEQFDEQRSLEPETRGTQFQADAPEVEDTSSGLHEQIARNGQANENQASGEDSTQTPADEADVPDPGTSAPQPDPAEPPVAPEAELEGDAGSGFMDALGSVGEAVADFIDPVALGISAVTGIADLIEDLFGKKDASEADQMKSLQENPTAATAGGVDPTALAAAQS